MPQPETPTARVTAEVTGMEHQVDLRIASAPTMTIGPRTVTPVGVRIAYEDSEVVMVRIDGRGPSGYVDYYPLNDPSDWPEWLAALVEEHQPVERAAVRVTALAEAADGIVAVCFTHNPDAATGWITCHCEVADDLRKQAALLALPTT